MFYSLNILKKKNAQFYLIWKLAHNGNVSKKEVENVDIEKYCQDLRSYIPTGSSKDVRNEVKTKMSLYLLSILYYGIVITHHKKVEAFLSKLEHFLNSLKPQIAVQVKKRPPLLEQQEQARPKKRRRTLQMLEFEGDPLSVLTEDKYWELNRQITLPDDIIQERPLDADELMAELERELYPDAQENVDSLLPEVPHFIHEEIIPEYEMQFTQKREGSYEAELKYNSLMDLEMAPPHEVREWDQFLDTVNQPSLFELDAGPLRVDNSVDISINSSFDFVNSSNRIVLPQIDPDPRSTTGRRNPPARRLRRHNARIFYDEEISLDDDEISNGLQNFSDCIQPLERPSRTVKNCFPQLFRITSNLPEYVLDKYGEMFERSELGELRQLLNDIPSSPVHGRISPREEKNIIPEEPMPEVQTEMGMQFPVEEQAPPYEIIEDVPPKDELRIQMKSLDEIEERRRSSIAPSFAHRPSELEQPQFDVMDASRLNDENIPPENPEIVEKEKTPTRQQSIFESPTQERGREERRIRLNSPSDTRFDLHRRIYEKAQSQPVLHLDEVFTDPQSTREKAKDFFNLLWLLKEQKLESEQDEPFGRIKLMAIRDPAV